MGIFSTAKRKVKRVRTPTDDEIRSAHKTFGREDSGTATVISNSTHVSPKNDSNKFYPVKLGDVYHNDKYLVKGHLGSGRYSSVWLVKDTKNDDHAALKILNSDFYNGKHEIFELEVMEKVTEVASTSTHPGKDHVATLLDHFELNGPTGKHVCMVYRLLGEDIAAQTTRAKIEHLPYRAVKQITRQLLEALDFCHTECGVIHTDISPQNICIELADPVGAVAAAKPDSSGRIELATPSLIRAEHHINVRLNDFGIACFLDRHLTDNISPPLLRAPEITLGAPWDQSVDIFNLGALLLQFLTGQLPFPGRGERNKAGCDESDRLSQLIKTFGGEPDVVLANADRAKEFDKKGVDLRRRLTIGSQTSLEKFLFENATGKSVIDTPSEEVVPICNLLRRMLATDPRKRESAKMLLQHPWLAS